MFSAILSAPPEFTHPYYYIPWHVLVEPPVFCPVEILETELVQIPEVDLHLYDIASDAVDNWETKLVAATGNAQGWDFTLKEFMSEDEIWESPDCSVILRFERHPVYVEDLLYEGYAYSMFGLSEITVYYLERDMEKTFEALSDPNFKEHDIYLLYENQIASDFKSTLEHEIGHALGLDHPILSEAYSNYYGIPTANSIMVTPEVYPNLPHNIQYEITDYDVDSVVNLYGKNGIDEYEFGNIIALLSLGILAWFVVMLVFFIYLFKSIRKKIKTKKKHAKDSYYHLDGNFDTSESSNVPQYVRHKNCTSCRRILSDYPENKICKNCGHDNSEDETSEKTIP